MFPPLLARKALSCALLTVALPGAVLGVSNFAPNGDEYPIAGALPGDQVHPAVSINSSGGFLVWEDNVTDGSGLGISAVQLDAGYSAYFSPFRVNAGGAGDQERPQVAVLKGGGAAFIWQGGRQSFQHIYARFRSAAGTWLNANDVLVNSFTNAYQSSPVIASLANSNVVVVWSSYNQFSSTSLRDVYAQILSPTGEKVGSEFLVNQFTAYNQRTPSVAALSSGGFVIAWVTEQQRSVAPASLEFVANLTNRTSVDVYARIYGSGGAPQGNEFLVNSDLNVCANPAIAAASDGTFLVAWSQKDPAVSSNGWDVVARPYSSSGTPGTLGRVNTTTYGDQFAPAASASGGQYFLTWTSMGQDGSWEGVYGQVLQADGSFSGADIQVNTTSVSRQIHPAVASDGAGRFLAVWTSFTGLNTSFDLFAQRYLQTGLPLQAMNAPFVNVPFVANNGSYQPQIQVSWLPQAGLNVDHYEVYVDGANSPAASLNTNIWLMTSAQGLTANSTHTFQVLFVTTDARRSPLSPATSASTWMGFSWYGAVPFEWMASFYGYDTSTWPLPTAALAPDGPTLTQVFLSGASPTSPSTWLRTFLLPTPQGFFLSWNPQPGLIYQAQTSTDLKSWTNLGGPRFASGGSDSVYVGGNDRAYYRVLRLR
jgi:hypothetical protein